MRVGTNYNLSLISSIISNARASYSKSLMPVSTGSRINTLSDDPTNISELMQINSVSKRLDQYNYNIDSAEARVNVTDSTLSQVHDLSNEIYSLALQGNDSTISDSDIAAITDRLTSIKSEMMDYANTRLDGKYIFSGYKSTTEPFSGDPVVYNGDDNLTQIKITNTKSVTVGINGDNLFTGGDSTVDIFATIDELITAIQNGDSDEIGTKITDIQSFGDKVSASRSLMGNATKAIDFSRDALSNLVLQNTQRVSSLADVDVAKATTDLQFRQYTLQSAISVAQNVMSVQMKSFYN